MKAVAMALSSVLLCGACGGEAVENDIAEQKALLTTEFSDAVATSQQSADSQVISELKNLDGEVVVSAVTPRDGGEGTMTLRGAEPTAFRVPTPVSLEMVHQVLFARVGKHRSRISLLRPAKPNTAESATSVTIRRSE
jgi:hypothetical protein